ncbi:MAG: NAD(P)/FAD-dependent oxidoreductase [Acidobacteriota bacterium]
MSLEPHKTEVIVIGGGLAGLTVTAFLARAGKSVRLFEQSQELGGRARTQEQDGFLFNLGAHALYRGSYGIEVLRELGIEPKGAQPLTSGGFAIYDNTKHTLPAGFLSLVTTGLFNFSEKLEVGKLLGALPKLDANALMKVTLKDWLDETISHEKVKDLLRALVRVSSYVNAPELMSAGAAIDQLQKAFKKNVLYLDGGWQVLVSGVRDVARQAGAMIETNANVKLIERASNGAVRAVRLADGRVYEGDVVVIAASPTVAAALVENSKSTSLARWAQELNVVKAACLDLALERLPVENATFALGIDKPHYLSVHSAVAALAPEGGVLVHLMKYLPPDEQAKNGDVERELEGLMDLVQPGWRETVVHRRFLPALTVTHAIPTATMRGIAGRPGPQIEDVDGLFVVGDWIGNEGLLVDASLASARQAANLIVKRNAPQLAKTA